MNYISSVTTTGKYKINCLILYFNISLQQSVQGDAFQTPTASNLASVAAEAVIHSMVTNAHAEDRSVATPVSMAEFVNTVTANARTFIMAKCANMADRMRLSLIRILGKCSYHMDLSLNMKIYRQWKVMRLTRMRGHI